MNKRTVKIGVVTISDRASKGEYEDISGKAVFNTLKNLISNSIREKYILIPDEFSAIKQALITLADKEDCPLIITTGGTGPAARDITPDVTELVCSRMLPGFGEVMRAESLKYVKTAILSRQSAGIRGHSLIVNLPGSPKAIQQCLEAVFPAIPHCVKMLSNVRFESENNELYTDH